MTDLLQQLNITKQELTNKLIDTLIDEYVHGDYDHLYNELDRGLKKYFKETIDSKLETIFKEQVEPLIHVKIDNLILQQTNEWGESKGKEYTLVEYLVDKSEHWLNEHVDYKGNGKREGSWGWRKDQTRLANMINEHLAYQIESALEKTIKNLKTTLNKSLEETLKIKLNNIISEFDIVIK